MEKLTICCDVYFAYEKVGRIEIIDGVLVKNEVYTDNIILHPCPRTTTLISVLEMIKSRVICPERCDSTVLDYFGLKEYNIYEIFRRTHGVDGDDYTWFKFDGEGFEVCWDNLNPRRPGYEGIQS